jgi:hypothetical protein
MAGAVSLPLVSEAEGAAARVLERFDEIADCWSDAQLARAAAAIEAVVTAEDSYAAWNPKEITPRHLKLARLVGQAARTAKMLAESFPSDNDHVGALIGRLVDFVVASVNSVPAALESRFDIKDAQKRLREMRQDHALAALSNVLVADLVAVFRGLEPGGRGVIDESVIRRRYVTRNRPLKVPASDEWNRHWPLIREVATLGRERGLRSVEAEEAFVVAVHTYLETQ